MLKDLGFGFRQLFNRRDFSVVTILTLALAMGAITVMFSVLHAVVLRPLPLPEPHQLVRIYSASEGEIGLTSPANFLSWQRNTRSFQDMAARRSISVTVGHGGRQFHVPAARVSPEYFAVLGLGASRGRVFGREEALVTPRVVVLSHRFWTEHLGGPDWDNSTISIDEVAHAVLGVMPPEADFRSRSEALWLPLNLASQAASFGSGYLDVVARLKPGGSLQQARRDLENVTTGLRELDPVHNRGLEVQVTPMASELVGDYRLRLFVLAGASALVLLIACANVANLLLARGALRVRELALRSAVGASPTRLLRQLITENLLLSLSGTSLGLLLGIWCLDLVLSLSPGSFPRLEQARIDGLVLAAVLGAGLLASLVFGLVPAWRSTRPDLLANLQTMNRGRTLSAPGDRLRQALVVAEVSLTLILLVGSGLLIRSAMSLGEVNTGFESPRLFTAWVSLPHSRYRTAATTAGTFDRFLENVRRIPGVESAALASEVPAASGGWMGWIFESRPETDGSRARQFESALRFASPGFFATLKIPLLRGRSFLPGDRSNTPQVVIINRRMAQLLWGGIDVVGKSIRALEADARSPEWEIVGVVENVRYEGPMQPPRAEFYIPLAQVPDGPWYWTGRAVYLAARTSSPPLQYTEAVRAVLASVDPGLPLQEPRSMDERVSETLAAFRFNSFLLTSLGLLGLALAAAGIYSVVSHFVTQRGRELGVRMALGATRSELRRLILFKALLPVGLGVVIGSAAALGLSSLLSALLFGVGWLDPVTFLAMGALLLAVGTAACLRPIGRAVRLNPNEVLRNE